MSFSKQAHEAATAKVAAADRTEREHAVDVGFALGCKKLGLDQSQTQKLAKVAMARIEAAQKKVAIAGPAGATAGFKPVPKPTGPPAVQPPLPVPVQIAARATADGKPWPTQPNLTPSVATK